VANQQFVCGDRVEYTGAPVFDGRIATGDVGWVTKVEHGWVFASWPRGGIHSVPARDVRRLQPEVTRTVDHAGNAEIWDLLGEELPALSTGRPRDPYMSQGCHPDVVARVWDDLGGALAVDCRAQAKGKPVLAHPRTQRIFALAHGSAYALWLTPADLGDAERLGASTTMRWSGGSVTNLAHGAAQGWIWGNWLKQEPMWVRRAYAACAVGQSPQ
jgi:hypothetical protein